MLKTFVHTNPQSLGQAAGQAAAACIKSILKAQGKLHLILATGTSQFETLKVLVQDKDIDWSKVVLFHLDEYIGIHDAHPASFRKYLKERFIQKVPGLKAVHLIQTEGDPQAECERLGALIQAHPIDLALVGIGENGHLAFNDPPADVVTEQAYLVVPLDEACRQQQLGEGWFPSLEAVPSQAISMSIKQILRSKKIIASVPDARKAQAVKDCLEKEISPWHPASYLRTHPDCELHLDASAAALLSSQI